MRCGQCNKFVGQDLGDPEIEGDPELDPTNGEVTCDVRIHADCAECSEELKEETLNLQGEFPAEIIDAHQGAKCELEVENDDPEPIDEYATHDRHGKRIKNMRYSTHYYGASVDVHLRCACQKATPGKKGQPPVEPEPLATITLSDKVAAGSMNELQ